MRPDLAFTPAPTRIDVVPGKVPRQQSAAAASSASSPGRRPRTLRAREKTPRADPDTFTHLGATHRLVRFMPGDRPVEPVPHRDATASLPTEAGGVTIPVTATARCGGLVHVVFTDDTGDTFGAWCPARRVAGGTTPPPI